MAKLKAPLFSLGASGAIGKALVYFGWKGIDAVREYVIPANPKSDDQITQRGFLTAAVVAIHDAQKAPIVDTVPNNLQSDDESAYSALARVQGKIMTWFNSAVKNFVDTNVDGKVGAIFRAGATTEEEENLAVEIFSDAIVSEDLLAATFFYGTSPTSLIKSEEAVIVKGTGSASADLPFKPGGIKLYWQLRADVADDCEGAMSGIYHGTPEVAAP